LKPSLVAIAVLLAQSGATRSDRTRTVGFGHFG